MKKGQRFRVLELIRHAEGGMKQHYITLVKGLKNRGIEVIALCDFKKSEMDELIDCNIDVIPFSLKGELAPLEDLAAVIKIIKIIKRKNIDVIHCHGFKAGIIGRLAGWITSYPCVYTVHNFLPSSISKIKKLSALGIEKILSSKTHTIIAVSRALKNYEQRMFNIPKEKIEVVYNGIHIPHREKDYFNVRRKWGIKRNDILVGTVARLIPSKGIDFLIQAVPEILNKYPNVKFMIVGDGPEEERLKELAERFNCKKNIVFTGYIKHIWNYYEAFDIFVLPTLSEGLGISILEAMAKRKAVIASNTGGISEIIVHGVNGYLISPKNSLNIAEAILDLIVHQEKRMKYGEAGYHTVTEKFDNSIMVNKTSDILIKSIKTSNRYIRKQKHLHGI